MSVLGPRSRLPRVPDQPARSTNGPEESRSSNRLADTPVSARHPSLPRLRKLLPEVHQRIKPCSGAPHSLTQEGRRLPVVPGGPESLPDPEGSIYNSPDPPTLRPNSPGYPRGRRLQ